MLEFLKSRKQGSIVDADIIIEDNIAWVPKYRYKVLLGEVERDVENLMRAFSHRFRVYSFFIGKCTVYPDNS